MNGKSSGVSGQPSAFSGQRAAGSGQSYQTGAAGLFAMLARGERDVVTCPHCQSTETKLVDHDQQIYECLECRKVFER